MNRTHQPPGRRRTSWRISFFSALALLLLLVALLVVVPAASPTAGAATADFLRSVVGPRPVARLESLSYWTRDTIYRWLSPALPAGPRVSWAGGSATIAISTASAPSATLPIQTPSSDQITQPAQSSAAVLPAQSAAAVLVDAPQVGWQAYGPEPAGSPAMARALIMLDAQRSYAGVALVRMDLSRLQLHIVPGFIEPAHPSGIDQRIPNIGMIAPGDYGRLIAAFNGGFKALHGHYGMVVNQVTLLPTVDGLGTVAVYRDGSVRMGSWGQDLSASPDMISLRQNCPPLIDSGQINPALSTNAEGAWGFTNNSDITWRTGLGISRDSKYLIYAVGNGTNALFLAQALQKAGAFDAMQLDINQYYAHFMTYAADSSGQPEAQQLLREMVNERQIFLKPYPRDFFYVTVRP